MTSGGRRRRRGVPAFTLVEMLVSLAVLALALSVVGVVFTVTTKTVSQSAAYSETHTWVRQFMRQVEEDLRHCDPAKSVLVMHGRTVPAALTQDKLDAGQYYRVLVGDPSQVPDLYDPETDDLDSEYSEPRADILMFFSQRPTASKAPPLDPQSELEWAYARGVKFHPIQVVYGHAAIADAQPVGGIPTALRHIGELVSNPVGSGPDLSSIPASQWHLARRATIIEHNPDILSFDSDTLDQLAACVPTDGYAGDVGELDLPRYITRAEFDPEMSPYNPTAAAWNLVSRVLYADTDTDHIATVVDPVPIQQRHNLGVHMLPGCAWFQVEFLMPEDPRNSVVYQSPVPLDADVASRSDMTRWTTIEPGMTYVFVPDTRENRDAVASQVDLNGNPVTGSRLAQFARRDQAPGLDPERAVNQRIIRLWPYAIRVTVRVWDDQARLEEPIVRSVVHRFE